MIAVSKLVLLPRYPATAGELPARAAYKVTNGLAYGNINLWPFHHHHVHTQVWNPNQPRLPLYYDGYF